MNFRKRKNASIENLSENEQEFLKTQGHSCFLQSLLERKVYEQFKPFIYEKLKEK